MKLNYWKTGAVVIILIAVFYSGCKCGINSVVKVNHIDTTITKDSFIYRYKPVPYRVDSFIYREGKPYAVHDTTPGEVIINPVETNAIVARFNQVAYYNDSTERWRIKDTLYQNRIVGREVKVICFDTSITKVTTIYPPKKAILYLGFSAIGNPNHLLYGAGADLSLKMPNDIIFGAGTKLIEGKKLFYEGKVMFPLKPRKRN